MAKSRKEQIEDMLVDEPNDPFLRYGLAMEHASEGDEEAGARLLLELIQGRPDYVPAYLQAGQLLARLDRPRVAKTAGSIGRKSTRPANRRGKGRRSAPTTHGRRSRCS